MCRLAITDQVTPFEWTLHHSLGAVSHLVMMKSKLERRNQIEYTSTYTCTSVVNKNSPLCVRESEYIPECTPCHRHTLAGCGQCTGAFSQQTLAEQLYN